MFALWGKTVCRTAIAHTNEGDRKGKRQGSSSFLLQSALQYKIKFPGIENCRRGTIPPGKILAVLRRFEVDATLAFLSHLSNIK